MGAGCCKTNSEVGLDQSGCKTVEYEQGNKQTFSDQEQEDDHYLQNKQIQVFSALKEELEQDEEDIPTFKDISKYQEFVSAGSILLDKQPEMTNSMICLMISKYGKFKFYKKQFECPNSLYCPSTQLSDGCIYFGQWLNQTFHGRGKLITEEHSIYQGYFRNGKKQGYGRMLFSNGDYYQGEWFEDEMQGNGILILRDGTQFQGFFYQSIYIGNKKGMRFEDYLKKHSQQSDKSTTLNIILQNQTQQEITQKIDVSSSNIQVPPKKSQSQFKKYSEINQLNIYEQPGLQQQQSYQQQQQQQGKQQKCEVFLNEERNGEQTEKIQFDTSFQKSQLQQENIDDFMKMKQEQMNNLSIQKNSQQLMSGGADQKGLNQISQMNYTRREEENITLDKQSMEENNDDNDNEENNSRDQSMMSINYQRRISKCGDRLVDLYSDIDQGLEISNIEFNDILQKYLSNQKENDVNQSFTQISFQQYLPHNMKQKIAYFQQLLLLNNFHHDDIQGRIIDQMDFQTFRIYQQQQTYKLLQNKQIEQYKQIFQNKQTEQTKQTSNNEQQTQLKQNEGIKLYNQNQEKEEYKKKIKKQNEELERDLLNKIMLRDNEIESYKHIALLGLKQVYEKQGVAVRLTNQKEDRFIDDNHRNFNAVKQHLVQQGFILQNYYSIQMNEHSEWKYDHAINDKKKFADYLKQHIQEQNKDLQPKDIIILGIIKGINDSIIVDFYVKNEVTPIKIETSSLDEFKQMYQLPIIDEIFLSVDVFFDTQWNMVWDNNTTVSQYRGNINGQKQHYNKPNGYFGSALKVINKYPNDGWLANDTSDKTWIVLFHGCRKQSSQELLAEGYKQAGLQQYQGHACRFGRGLIKQGIYFYDQIQDAEKHADNFLINDKQYLLLFQCRVNPKTIKSPINKMSCYVASDPKDVRPYRILIKQLLVKKEDKSII